MWISVNNFGFKPKIVPLLFNRLIFVETVDLYSSNFFGDAMLVHEVYKLVSYLQLSQKTRYKRILIILAMMIQEIPGQNSSSGVSRHGAHPRHFGPS